MAFALPLSRYDYLYQLCSPCAHMSLVIFLCIYVRVSLSLVSRPPSWLCVSLYASTSVLLVELSQFSFVSPFIQQIKLRCFEFMFCLSDSAFVSHSCLHTADHDTKWVELNKIILPSDFFFQEYGTALGNIKTTKKTLLPSLQLDWPQFSRVIWKSKRHSVSAIIMLYSSNLCLLSQSRLLNVLRGWERERESCVCINKLIGSNAGYKSK